MRAACGVAPHALLGLCGEQPHRGDPRAQIDMFLVESGSSLRTERNAHSLTATATLSCWGRPYEEPAILQQLFYGFSPCLLQACCESTYPAQYSEQFSFARGGLQPTAVLRYDGSQIAA